MELLRELTQTPGVAGREQRIRDCIRRHAEDLFDTIEVDALGSLLCRRKPRGHKGRKGKGKAKRPLRVLLSAHMDQIGFLVRHVDEKGFLRVQNVGGFDTRNLFARLVTVCTADGDLTGVLNPGGKPVHIATEEERKKIPEVGDLLVDLGLSADEARKRARVGDMVVLQAPFAEIGHTVVAQALDNRIACWAVLRAVAALDRHDCEIAAVFSTQEEVGCRGAGPAAQTVDPDVALALDVTLCCDTPGVPEDLAITRQGAGAGLMVMDSSAIADLGLLEQLERVAAAARIPVQRTILPRGGTDASAIQRTGVGYRTAMVVCPVRYVHTITEMAHRDDLAATRDLLAAYLRTV